jgi:nitrous oxidase accessory protein NosD
MTKDDMKDQVGTARVVETWLDEGVRGLPEGEAIPDDLLRRVISDVDQTPQQVGRLGWLGRLGFRNGSNGSRWANRRQRLALTASLVVIAVLGASVLTVVRQPTDSIGHLIVVADGNGGFDSIGAAVAEAVEGETILIGPGTYTEAFVIDKPLILKGEGPVEDIIITAPLDGPEYESPSPLVTGSANYAILIQGVDASISGVTLQGETSRVFIDGGAATLDGLRFVTDTDPTRGAWARRVGSLVIDGGATPTISDSTFQTGVVQVFGDSDPMIERNTFTDGSSLVGEFGDRVVVRNNRFIGNSGTAIGFLGQTAGTFEGNEISGTAVGIGASSDFSGIGFAPVIVGNSITGNTVGIILPPMSGGEIRGNEIDSSGVAISLTEASTFVTDNELDRNSLGIRISGGSPILNANTVVGGQTGIHLQGVSSAELVGNTICGNETNIELTTGAVQPDLVGNDLCGESA